MDIINIENKQEKVWNWRKLWQSSIHIWFDATKYDKIRRSSSQTKSNRIFFWPTSTISIDERIQLESTIVEAELSPTRPRQKRRRPAAAGAPPVPDAGDGHLHADKVGDLAVLPAEDGAEPEQDPERGAVPAVVQQGDLDRRLRPDRLPHRRHGPAARAGALEDVGIAAEDVAGAVAGHVEKPPAGEDDGVAGEGRVGDEEVARQLLERLHRPLRVPLHYRPRVPPLLHHLHHLLLRPTDHGLVVRPAGDGQSHVERAS